MEFSLIILPYIFIIANLLNQLQVFGKRQLSRRSNRNDTAYHPAHRHTDSSGTPSLMNGPDGDRKSNITGTSRPIIAGHVHNSVGYKRHGDNSVNMPSDSAALVGLLGPNSPETTSRGHKHTNSSSSAFTPTSPVVPSYPSGAGAIVGLGVLTPGGLPFYRPPRTKTNTISITDSPNVLNRGSWTSGDWSMQRYDSAGNLETPTNSVPRAPFGHVHSESLGSLPGSKSQGFMSEDWDAPTALNTNNQNSGAATPPPFGGFHAPGSMLHQTTESTLGSGRGHIDYTVREMDFYYGVRGPALSSNAPSRKLGTGPADPTSPMAVAKGWIMNKFGRRKEKAKGFEVVRSSRAPQMLREMQEATEKAKKEKEDKASEDIGIAVTSDADDSSDEENLTKGHMKSRQVKTTTDSEEDGESDGDEGDDNYGEGPSGNSLDGQTELRTLHLLNNAIDISPTRSMSKRSQSGADGAPKVPRKSSKRRSANLSLPSPPLVSLHQAPTFGKVLSPTPVGSQGLYDSSHLSHLHLRQPQEQTRCSSTRLPFQTPSMHSGTSSRNDGGPLVNEANISPPSSRNSSNPSSILPHVPGLYNIHGGDGGSISGNTGAPGRPASVGTVSRHRMEDSLTEVTDQRALVAGLGSTAELVERTNSLASIEGEGYQQ